MIRCLKVPMEEPISLQEAYLELIRSIQDKLLILPDEVKVYPGHMGDTTIAVEKRYNPAAARF